MRREDKRTAILLITIFTGHSLRVCAGLGTSTLERRRKFYCVPVGSFTASLRVSGRAFEHGNRIKAATQRAASSLPHCIFIIPCCENVHGENKRCDRSPAPLVTLFLRNYEIPSLTISRCRFRGDPYSVTWCARGTFRRSRFPNVVVAVAVRLRDFFKGDRSDSEFFLREETNSVFKRRNESRVAMSYLVFHKGGSRGS